MHPQFQELRVLLTAGSSTGDIFFPCWICNTHILLSRLPSLAVYWNFVSQPMHIPCVCTVQKGAYVDKLLLYSKLTFSHMQSASSIFAMRETILQLFFSKFYIPVCLCSLLNYLTELKFWLKGLESTLHTEHKAF